MIETIDIVLFYQLNKVNRHACNFANLSMFYAHVGRKFNFLTNFSIVLFHHAVAIVGRRMKCDNVNKVFFKLNGIYKTKNNRHQTCVDV